VCVENSFVAEKGTPIIVHVPVFEAELLYITVFPSVVLIRTYTLEPSVVISRTFDRFHLLVSNIVQFPVHGNWQTNIPFEALYPQRYPAAEADDFTSTPGTFVHCNDEATCVDNKVLIPSVAVSYSD
jgi:hypothetical protein